MKHFLRIPVLIGSILMIAMAAIAQQPTLVAQTGHLDSIYALAFSPDGTLLASAGIDKTIIIWSLSEGRQIYSLKGHSEWIFSLAFSPDGKFLASGSSDDTVKVWSVSKGTKEAEISVKPNDVASVAFSRDGNTLAIAGEDKAIRLYDMSTRKMKPALSGHTQSVRKISFSPDGKHLVSLGSDRTLRMWDPITLRTVLQTDLKQPSTTLAYSPDGNLVAVDCGGDAVCFWDLRSGELRSEPLPQGSRSVDALTFTSDKELALADGFNLTLWNFETKVTRLASENTTGEGSNAVAITKDGSLLASNDGQHIKLLDLRTNHTRELKGGFDSVSDVAVSSDGSLLAAAVGDHLDTFGDASGVTDEERGAMIASLLGTKYVFVPSVGAIANFAKDSGEKGSSEIDFIVDPAKPESNRILKAHADSINSLSIHPNGNTLASSSEDGTVKFWDMKKLWNSKKPWNEKAPTPLKILREQAEKIAFSPDGSLLATESRDNTLKLWDTKTWKFRTLPNKRGIRSLLFSPNGELIAIAESGEKGTLTLWKVDTAKPLHSWSLDFSPKDFSAGFLGSTKQSSHVVFGEMAGSSRRFGSLSFSRDSSKVACAEINYATGEYRIKIWDTNTGEVLQTLAGHSASIRSTAFSPKGNVLASGSWDTTIRLWSTKTGEELATIAPVEKHKWVIYTSDGRFDTNTTLEDNKHFHWAMPGDVLNPLPLDIFMRDYFEPKLFQRLMNCSETGTCKREFATIRDLSELNTIRPAVRITDVSLPDENRMVDITVEVSQASNLLEREGREPITRTTGVYDLRVFRDRQLIGVSPVGGAEKLQQQRAGSGNTLAELKVWREASEVKVDSRTGTQAIRFRAKLPRSKDASQVRFTAYAFNEDRVKSLTASYEWSPKQEGKLPRAQLDIKRRAYVISVGVNRSRIARWNLRYAANDAHQFQKVIPEELLQVGGYDVVPIELVSDLKDGRSIENATKQNVKSVLDLLAGRDVSSEIKQKIPNAHLISRATPDDLVLITFSSHGYTDNDGRFYLLPSDVSRTNRNQKLPDLWTMISSEELSVWLREVDAGEMVMILDACHAAAAVEGLEFKPGPLGSRGLGQLAYDKRIKVLTATQASNFALEVGGKIKQGLLSYALVKEGLNDGLADSESNSDGKILLGEWLQYGERRVASLYRDVAAGKIKGVVWKGYDDPGGGRNQKSGSLQRASLFNFSPESDEVVLRVITKLKRSN